MNLKKDLEKRRMLPSPKKEKYFEVSYRNEFMAIIKAETEEEAIKQFCNGKYKNGKNMCYENISELHQEFFEVEECDFEDEQEKTLLQKYINGFATDNDKDKLIKLLMKSNNEVKE